MTQQISGLSGFSNEPQHEPTCMHKKVPLLCEGNAHLSFELQKHDAAPLDFRLRARHDLCCPRSPVNTLKEKYNNMYIFQSVYGHKLHGTAIRVQKSLLYRFKETQLWLMWFVANNLLLRKAAVVRHWLTS